MSKSQRAPFVVFCMVALLCGGIMVATARGENALSPGPMTSALAPAAPGTLLHPEDEPTAPDAVGGASIAAAPVPLTASTSQVAASTGLPSGIAVAPTGSAITSTGVATLARSAPAHPSGSADVASAPRRDTSKVAGPQVTGPEEPPSGGAGGTEGATPAVPAAPVLGTDGGHPGHHLSGDVPPTLDESAPGDDAEADDDQHGHGHGHGGGKGSSSDDENTGTVEESPETPSGQPSEQPGGAEQPDTPRAPGADETDAEPGEPAVAPDTTGHGLPAPARAVTSAHRRHDDRRPTIERRSIAVAHRA